jgi:transcriptional regulator with XRE-family HTH domain
MYGKALNQELLGRWLGLNQGQVSRLEKAPKADLTIETLQNYALILHLPQHLLWFDLPGQSRLNLLSVKEVDSKRRAGLVAARKAAGYTQEGLAYELNVDPNTIARWEAGNYAPLPYMRPKLARLLGRSQQQLEDLIDEPRRDTGPSDPSQGDSLVSTTGMGSLELPTLAQRRDILDPSAASYVRIPMRAELLTHYESLTDNYRLIDYQAGARAVYDDTVAHLNRLLAAADNVPSGLYGRYIALLGDTAQLAAWLAIDGQEYPTARHFCSIALSSAEEGEDPTSHSYVLGVMSYIHLHAHRGNEAVRLLDSALRIANTPRFGVNPVVRSWLYEAMAEAYAFTGDLKAGAKALAQAEQLFDKVQADNVPHWLGFYNAQEHAARLKGRCLIRLGDGREAIRTLESACELLPEQYVRERSGTLIDLATAHLMDGKNGSPEPEAAADAADEAWRLALLTNSGRNQRRIRELLPAFEPYARLDIVQSLTDKVQ